MMAGRGPRGAVPDAKDAGEWFAGRLPEGWFDGPPTVTVDREEIVVVGAIFLAVDIKGNADTAEQDFSFGTFG